MKVSQTFIPTLREVPADAVIVSHRLMFRSGMIRKLANGLFAYLPLGLKSFRKVERIIREEMDAIGSLEIKPTVVVPGELWKESGRWETFGDGMLRVKNRLDNDFVVSPTAEEAFTSIVRDELNSYRQLPLSLYQINTKYRDEVRPRYGVMRGREFVMKDAYSFHTNDESLDEHYQAMGRAYRRIFKRCGLTVIPVKADSGAMGGSGSEEFMVESEVGDNTLLLCKSCEYAANVEKAACKPDFNPRPSVELARAAASSTPPLEKIDTPEVKTIEELCGFLKTNAKTFIKTLIYKAVNVELDLREAPGCSKLNRVKLAPEAPELYPEAFFAVAIRGDLDVNEVKLAAQLKASEVMLAADTDVVRLTGCPVGFAGPVGLASLPVIVDHTVTALSDAVTGALAKDLHYKHAAYGRDFEAWLIADVRTVKAGDRCPLCGGELYEKKGNELGHIFKLGYKYTKSMNVSYLDVDGKSAIPTMGCYGIGLDRTLASVIEEHHDDDGIIWPVTVAPYQVIIVPIKYDGAVKEFADRIAGDLEKSGLEVLLDDRDERPGVKFKDADLTGIPFRLVVGDKNLAGDNPKVEVKRRSEKENRLVEAGKVVEELSRLIQNEIAELNK
ncbi:proline--tRNA ligase [Leadbettera azotonutricia]|uniref:Proline--tRNA ligase n=1 Tax=Leadbettera azotonutricia (strain ATCC BAA-888 / DSM 13862 / ZAS-9) TaxID=545695 RepID=F5Y6M2_LEAAZ|nr:proline--tRNA ligase [Leadbettera azotonutricia]AEF81124.1 proline--tRNA ligase [Leadbettera azotonutricia ZAS-9]